MKPGAAGPTINDETLSALEGAGSCPNLKCRYVLLPLKESAPVYFKQGFVTCSHCGTQVDLWEAAFDRAKRLKFHGASALVSFGAVQTSFVMEMESGKYHEVDLASRGVPADARILRRIYTGQSGDMTAVEWHSNAPPLRFPGTTLRLLGVPFGEGPLPRIGRVGINVVWIRREGSDEWSYLVTAFEAAAAGDYAPALVFAQSAVEISVMPLIENRLRQHAPAKEIKRFMIDSLSYNYALKVVLPYLCGEASIPQMPVAVSRALDRLRDKRNKIIHRGASEAAVAPEDAMEGLCAAAFGFEYMRFIEPTLSGRRPEEKNTN